MKGSQFLKICSALFLCFTLLSVISACSGESDVAVKTYNKTPLKKHKIIKISGSDIVEILIRKLRIEYLKQDPFANIKILKSSGTTGGLQGVRKGILDIGLTDRPIINEKLGPDIIYEMIASDEIAFAIHPLVGINYISLDNINKIYSGEISNWSEIGGTDVPIIVLDRAENSLIRKRLRSHVFLPSLTIRNDAITFKYDSDLTLTIAKEPFSIGYSTIGSFNLRDLNVNIIVPAKEIKHGGTAHAHENNTASNPQVSPLAKAKELRVQYGIIYPKKHPSEVDDFLRFIRSTKAKAIMRQNGLIIE